MAVRHLAGGRGEWLAQAGGGDGTEDAARWLKEGRLALPKDGHVGLCEYVRQGVAWVPDRAGLEGATPGVRNSFRGRRGRLSYALRSRRGQPIGSGRIEGACKQMIGKRMKQAGAPGTWTTPAAWLCSPPSPTPTPPPSTSTWLDAKFR